jgi:opacity protein-like surface antigen
MKKIYLLLLAVVLVGGVVTAKAGLRPDSSIFTIYAGAAFPLDDDNNYTEETMGEAGPMLGLQYLACMGKYFAFGLDATGSLFGKKEFTDGLDEISLQPAAGTLMAVGRITLVPSWFIRPYALAGVGGNLFKAKLESTTGGVTTTLLDESSGGLVYAFGAGAEIDLGSYLLIGVEGRWYRLSIDKDKFGGLDHYTLATAAAKIGFKFGGTK